jgi:hypothetical protein
MPIYILEELSLADNWEREAYSFYEELYEQKQQEQEGLIYLFREWLDLVSPTDFGTDEGLEGAGVKR